MSSDAEALRGDVISAFRLKQHSTFISAAVCLFVSGVFGPL